MYALLVNKKKTDMLSSVLGGVPMVVDITLHCVCMEKVVFLQIPESSTGMMYVVDHYACYFS